MKIDDLYWHDGNLIDVHQKYNKQGDATILLIVALYKNVQSKKRTFYKIKCITSNKTKISINNKELKDNFTAGNIDKGYLKNNTLNIYLFGGIIKIKSNKFKVSKVK